MYQQERTKQSNIFHVYENTYKSNAAKKQDFIKSIMTASPQPRKSSGEVWQGRPSHRATPTITAINSKAYGKVLMPSVPYMPK